MVIDGVREAVEAGLAANALVVERRQEPIAVFDFLCMLDAPVELADAVVAAVANVVVVVGHDEGTLYSEVVVLVVEALEDYRWEGWAYTRSHFVSGEGSVEDG